PGFQVGSQPAYRSCELENNEILTGVDSMFPRVRWRRRITIMILLSVLLLILGLGVFFIPDRRLDPARISEYTTEELVAGCEHETVEWLGSENSAWVEPFIPIENDAKFVVGPFGPVDPAMQARFGNAIGPTKPIMSPVMMELVKRGVRALPAL